MKDDGQVLQWAELIDDVALLRSVFSMVSNITIVIAQ